MNRPLLAARIVLILQALVVAGIALLTTMAQFVDRVERPLRLDLLIFGVPVLFAVTAIVAAIRFGPGRSWSWISAMVVHSLAAFAYGWWIYDTNTADLPEAAVDLVALLIGTPLLFMSVCGLVLLYLPAVLRACFPQRT